mmetsp:Transcript_15869/g.49344  ORF Transcript_15869/g.49344 Transcript_15869/m.49344 type:complete len:435 (-) Transcript_15869:58-1362(-)
MHKRTYGNRLTFLDVQERGPDTESTGDRPEGDNDGLEVVFCFEVYGAEVRTVRKDISAGDVVHFEGRFRPRSRVLDAVSYRMLQRWSDRGDGEHFAVKRHRNGKDHPVVGHDPSSSSSRPKSFCKFWLSNGSCSRVGCRCDHPEGEALRAARSEYWESQKKRRAESANPDDPHRSEDKRSHAHRAGILAEWLCATYGLEELREHGVVELAGGRGDLAFELGVKRRIPCTVVDPRCPGGDAPVGSWHGWRLTKPQRAWLETNLTGVRGFAPCQAYVESCPIRQCQAFAPADLSTAGQEARAWWAQVVGSCRVVVGLHPDQATGSILQLALAFGRPYAAVPCCTFADDFPERRLADGRPVRTFDDLVEWMRAHDAATELDFLGFHGKNLVVFLRKAGGAVAAAAPPSEAACAPLAAKEPAEVHEVLPPAEELKLPT